MQKLKLSVMSFICCCTRENDSVTPQPTINLESKQTPINNLKYEVDNDKSVKLEMAEFKPETPKIHKYPYYCPICFRYFNKMMKTTCCNNYVCELCSNDIQKKNETLKSKCLYCNSDHITLLKVEPSDIIKKYTDSPYIEKVIKAGKVFKKSKFSTCDPVVFSLNDVLKSHKELNIGEVIEKALNSNIQDDFVKIIPKKSSKVIVGGVDPSFLSNNDLIVRDLIHFKENLEDLIIRQNSNIGRGFSKIKPLPPSKIMKTTRFLSLN